MFLHGKKSFILKISLLKKTLFTAKDIYEIYENIFHIYIYIYIYKYIFMQKMFELQTKNLS